MALKKGEKWLVIALMAVVVLFAVTKITGKKPKTANVPKSTISKIVDKVKETTSPDDKVAAVEKQQIDQWGKDPFHTEVKVVRIVKKKPDIVCKGKFISEGRTYVIINDMIMSEGDEKKGILVEKIDGNQIYCRFDNEVIILNWKGST